MKKKEFNKYLNTVFLDKNNIFVIIMEQETYCFCVRENGVVRQFPKHSEILEVIENDGQLIFKSKKGMDLSYKLNCGCFGKFLEFAKNIANDYVFCQNKIKRVCKEKLKQKKIRKELNKSILYEVQRFVKRYKEKNPDDKVEYFQIKNYIFDKFKADIENFRDFDMRLRGIMGNNINY